MNKFFILAIFLPILLLLSSNLHAEIAGLDSIEPDSRSGATTLSKSTSNNPTLRSKRYGYYGWGYGGCCCCGGGWGGYGFGPFGVGLFGMVGGLLFGGWG